MTMLDDSVRKVVDEFIASSTLFTALDVSNEVKKVNPLARHREVRDVVRALFSDMETNGYARTTIKVKMNDGSTVEALLYHHLSDSWDLDSKYGDQKRSQTVTKPNTFVPATNVTHPAAPVTISSPTPVIVKAPAIVVAPPAPVNPKQLWDNLFNVSKILPRS